MEHLSAALTSPEALSEVLARVSDLERAASQQELEVAARAHALVTAHAQVESRRQTLLDNARRLGDDREARGLAATLSSIEIDEYELDDTYSRRLQERMKLAEARLEGSRASMRAIVAQEQKLHARVDPMLTELEAEIADIERRLRAARARRQPQSQPQGAGRRVHQRVNVAAEVSWSSEDNFYTGFSMDVSEGGVFVSTIELLDIGSPVELDVRLPTGARIQATGEVRWIREYNDMTPLLHPGMGIQFTQLPAEYQDAIAGFVNQREPLFFVD